LEQSSEESNLSPKRKKIVHEKCEEIIPLAEFFKPEELKWNQEKLPQTPDLNLKEDQIGQFSKLLIDCDQLSPSGAAEQ
jgi:hypothetical protein